MKGLVEVQNILLQINYVMEVVDLLQEEGVLELMLKDQKNVIS